MRDDLPILTRELVDETRLASAVVGVRFAVGSASLPIFREISAHLAAVRGAVPDVIDGVGLAIYFHPDAATTYIRGRSGPA